MKLATFAAPGGSVRAGEVVDDAVRAFPADLTVTAVLAGAAPDLSGESWPLPEVTLLADRVRIAIDQLGEIEHSVA